MSKLLLSFIMPTFNSSEYLAKTMDSLIASIGRQSSSVEIICVDDGSTDNTVAILEEYKSVFDNLIVIRNNHGGVSQARNTALDMVSGTFISFVDSDDLFEENFLDIFSSIENNFDILFTDVKSLASNLYIPRISFEKKIDVFKNSLRIGEFGIEPGVAGKFFRTEIVNKNRIRFNTELSVSEDVLFNFNFITYADNVLLSSEKFYTVKKKLNFLKIPTEFDARILRIKNLFVYPEHFFLLFCSKSHISAFSGTIEKTKGVFHGINSNTNCWFFF